MLVLRSASRSRNDIIDKDAPLITGGDPDMAKIRLENPCYGRYGNNHFRVNCSKKEEIRHIDNY